MNQGIKKTIVYLIIIVMIISAFPLEAKADGDSISNAYVIEENTSYELQKTPNSKHAYYKFSLDESALCSFVITADYSAAFTIYTAQGTMVATTKINPSNSKLDYSVNLSSGDYYIDFEMLALSSTQKYVRHKFTFTLSRNNEQIIEDDTLYKYFADVPEGTVGETEINNAYEQGLVGGFGTNAYGKQIYKPGKSVTRVQFAIMLYNLANKMGYIDDVNKVDNCTFTDIGKGDSGYKEVAWANSNGIITGFNAKSFKPKNSITRAQITMMLIKYANYIGEDTSNRIENAPIYSDYIWVQDNFRDSVKWAMAEGILTGMKKGGYPVINPDGLATRAQCAMFVWRYYSKEHIYLKSIEENYAELQDRVKEIKDNNLFVCDIYDNLCDIIISDEGEVLGTLNESGIREDIDFTTEYRVIASDDFESGTLYSLNQIVNGIDVVGGELFVYTDREGYVSSIYGSYISYDFPMSYPSLSFETRNQIALNRTKEVFNSSNVEVRELGTVIREYEGEYLLVYAYEGSVIGGNGFNTLSFYVNSKTQDTIYESFNVSNVMEEQNAEGQQGNQTLDVEHTDGKYYLLDTNRKLKVINAANDKDWLNTINNNINDYRQPFYKTPYWTDDNSVVDNVSPAGVDILANIERASSCYSDLFNRSNMKDVSNDSDDGYIFLVVNADNNGEGMNAYAHGDAAISVTLLYPGFSDVFSTYIDVMGHEYTHGVIYNEVVTRKQVPRDYSHDFDAINEGLADVFGNLVEDYCDDSNLNGTGNGRIDVLSREMSEFLLASKYHNNPKMESHKGIPVISYPVYLMNKGIDGDSDKIINNRQVAYMLYDLLPRLDQHDSFIKYRMKLENLIYNTGRFGDEYQFTGSQKDCLIDALDSAGIEPTYVYKLLTNGKIYTAGTNHKVYYKTDIEIRDLSGEICACEENNLGGMDLSKYDLEPGIYNIIVKDKANDEEYTYSCILNDNNDHSSHVKQYKPSITVFVDNVNSYKDDYDWKSISLINLSSYLDGGADMGTVSDFLPFIPGYENSSKLGLRAEMTVKEAKATIKDGLGFKANSIWSGRRTFTVNGIEWDYYKYPVAATNNAIRFFTGLDISTDRLTNGAEGLEVKYDGYYLYAPAWYAGPPSVKLVKAEKCDTDIRIYYYWGGPGPIDDPWVAYFGKLPNGKYRLYSTKHTW